MPNVKKSGALTYPDSLGPSRRPVVGETFTFIQISNVKKIPPLEAELFHENGQPEKYAEANSRISQFCEICSTAFAPGCGLFRGTRAGTKEYPTSGTGTDPETSGTRSANHATRFCQENDNQMLKQGSPEYPSKHRYV